VVDNLLIVEDNKALAKIMALHITKNSVYNVILAHSFEEAKAIMIKNHFLAALLDLNLPDAPNGEIVDEALSKGIPSIVLTGNFDQATRELILKKPIIDYVYKEKISDIDYILTKIDRMSKNRYQKILVVDDSKVVRSEIKDFLSRELYKVYTVGNGEEAIGFYRDNPDISLVVTDMNMPLMNGLDLVVELRKMASKNNLSIIGISSDSQTAVNFLKFGANDFIKKPFSKEEFMCRVNNAVEALENIQQISHMSVTDALTGVHNRRYFFEEFEEYYRSATALSEKFALATFDIDNFKSINDTYGHPIGDDVIKMVANAIKTGSRGNDVVARIGGEEFCLLLKSTDEKHAYKIVEEIRKNICSGEFVSKRGESFAVTISAGLSTKSADSSEEMLDESDALLYKAKTSGKNRVCIG